jgi:2-polyprenyl-3-methyl-5-hydroxy-6-metoxy-1,4-benzoquinol methylase
MSQATGWWTTFFSGMILEAVRGIYPPEHTKADADFLERALRLTPGAKVADVPCGDGRISLELAARGYRVVGVDLARELVGVATQAAEARGLGATFECRDMRDLPWQGELDGIFCFGNSFGYLVDTENREFLRAAGRALKAGGRFVMETGLAAESILANFASTRSSWSLLGSMYMLREASYDPVAGMAHTDYTILRGAEVEQKRA